MNDRFALSRELDLPVFGGHRDVDVFELGEEVVGEGRVGRDVSGVGLFAVEVRDLEESATFDLYRSDRDSSLGAVLVQAFDSCLN